MSDVIPSKEQVELYELIAAYLNSLGWTGRYDAQWERLRDGLPELKRMLSQLQDETTNCGPNTPWDCLCGEPSCPYCGLKKATPDETTDNCRDCEGGVRMRDALLAIEGSTGPDGLYENKALHGVAREGLLGRVAVKTSAECSRCAAGMNSFIDPGTGKTMHARNGVVELCSAQSET